MATMPNPFLSSAVVERPAEASAVASYSPQVPDAAADSEYVDLDLIDEIFVGARKLIDPDEHRFVLDVERFMLDIEEPPLFLRQAVRA